MSAVNDSFFFDDNRSAAARAHERIKELLASGVPLRDTLTELVRIVENLTPSGMVGSVLTELITHTAAMAIEHDREQRSVGSA
jgi:hypothetical protein